MAPAMDSIDRSLLNDWQKGFPLVARPFAEIGRHLGIAEAEVLRRFERLATAGAISRIGATCRPNTAGASTLAAVAAPEYRIDEIAAVIGAEEGVNHSYLRENAWNIWFVATGPDRSHVDATLARVARRTGLRVLDLPLVRPFNISLAFALDGPRRLPPARNDIDTSVLEPGDREIMQALSEGLPITTRPFAVVAGKLGRTEAALRHRISVLEVAGLLARVGVIVRHRALGWTANAMVVWELPPDEAERIGPALAAVPGVTLCYQRRPVPDVWPYTLYCMIHARSRNEAIDILGRACAETGLGEAPHQVLFSLRCFKQTGAMVASPNGAAA